MMSEQLKTAVIVEDDPDIRHLLVEVLEAAGFSTVSVGNGIDGIQAVLSYRPLLTTLDVNMPGIDGFEAARRIRAQSDTYIIMLTGLSEEADVVLGLGSGADEYIVKPFRPREFRARVDALLRRPRAAAPQQTPQQDSVGPSFPGARPAAFTPAPPPAPAPAPAEAAPMSYEEYLARFPGAAPQQPMPQQPAPPQQVPPQQVPPQQVIVHHPSDAPMPAPVPTAGADLVVHQPAGDLVPAAGEHWLAHRDLQVDTDTRLAYVSGRELDLTRTEFDLLSTLMASKRRVRSKADLTLVLRGESYVTSYFVGEADKRAIEAHMTNLRRKLGDNPTTPRYIETVRGVGYRMTSENAAV
ncbi:MULTISPECIES: response regulator transcription factor [Microbacterium]|uniref:response regulator transcription factor n=1 Tax=Microbacterium TaxID=33882 RepID=UPI00249EBC28|nr:MULTISPECIES: response regulator transcription factor [Microbacterium]WHE35790.1 response regulator transcription factor [Microbacterium sp. BDGP8]WRK16962.1 response regulator transcription factor [Microbacterium plantarum]